MLLKKQGKYQFEDFEVDLARRTIYRGGRSITVSPRSFDLLILLMRNTQRPVGKEELMHTLWPGADVEESNLNQHIFLLRKALTGNLNGERILISVPGKGFQFVSAITELSSAEFDPGGRRFMAAPALPSQAIKIDPVTIPEISENSEPLEAPLENEPVKVEQAIELSDHLRSEKDADETETDEEHNDAAWLHFIKGFRHPGRAQWIALGTVALMLALLAIVMSQRAVRGPAPQSLSLVIAQIDNTTGDKDFDAAITAALATDLEQSPYLSITTLEPTSQDKARQSQEACSRFPAQRYITGTLRRLAGKYFLTVRAYDCSGNTKFASTIGIADTPDQVIGVLDRVTVDFRKQLGEPASSVARFSKPLFAQRTPSLEALKAYSGAVSASQQAKPQDAVTLLSRAVEIDPQFALAFARLGTAYSALGQKSLAEAALNSAYQLRETAGERNKLSIEADYHRLVTGDLLGSIRTDKQWHEEYPRDPLPLKDLSEIDIQIGRPSLALEAAQQALALSPTDSATYVLLARAQLHLGQIEEAAATCHKAIAQHADNLELHGFLYQAAFLRLDQPAMDEQVAWSKAHGTSSLEENYLLLQQGQMNIAQGKVKAGVAILTHLAETYRAQNQGERADRLLSEIPRMEAELGYLQTALSRLENLPEIHGSADVPVAWAETGETYRAQKLLQRELDTYPTATLWQQDLGPQIRAAIALDAHEPDKALTALEQAKEFELRSFDVPAMAGRAYLSAKKPALAETAFRKILDHPGIEPLSYNYPLAQLGLARALAQQGKLVDATQVYQVVLAIWKDADADLLRLKDAKAEYARLSGASIALPRTALLHTPSAKPFAKSVIKPTTQKKPAASKR
jgi:DNA-binding winged helix-turn-helix (wHTH) protein/tetratricopeptide (TPR) repeat protein